MAERHCNTRLRCYNDTLVQRNIPFHPEEPAMLTTMLASSAAALVVSVATLFLFPTFSPDVCIALGIAAAAHVAVKREMRRPL